MLDPDEWAEREEAVFIVGPARSGTSVMYRTLGEAPGFWPLKRQVETNAFVRGRLDERPLRTSTAKYLGNRHDAFIALADGGEHSRQALVRRYFHEASKQYDSGRLIEKSPKHVDNLPALFAAFPLARIVIMRRNPRDMIVSHRARYRRDVARNVPESEIEWLRAPVEHLLDNLQRIDAAISHALSTWPDRIVDISYEHLIESPAAQLKVLGERLAMPAEDVDVMISNAMRARATAPDESSFPLRDAPLGQTIKHIDMLTPAEEEAIASVSFVHFRA